MAHGNGNGKPPIPFVPQGSNIPIVGQPFAVKGGFPTVSLQCMCAAREPVLLISNTPGHCPACGRAFVVAAFAFNGQTGQIQVQVGLMQSQPQPVPEPAGAM